MRQVEILSPAGNYEALEAAVKAGADAVYAGGELFSARAFAGNFNREEFLKAIDYCHIYGVRLYMALNTLLKDDEIRLVKDYMEPFYKAGLDGVIVQDMGVVKVIRDNYPDLPIHGSTQMSICSAAGAGLLKKIGFTRVVPARELSLAEIISIKKKTDIEIETFIHGAMCFSYSGKCLLSSFIGGRSGNRGRCAQPCRQCYRLMNENGKAVCSEYVMSLRDMCTLSSVPELIRAGIDSFKIEGRMKKPEYVAATTFGYRQAVDMYVHGVWNEGEIEKITDEMRDIYNRGGFSGGYYFMQNGKEMLAGKRPNHTGIEIGRVSKVVPPEVHVSLVRDVNSQDVLEIRAAEIELTAANGKKAGDTLILKGREFKKIRSGMQVFRTRNNELLKRIEDDIIRPEKVLEAMATVCALIGRPLSIRIEKGDIVAKVYGNIVGTATNRPSDEKIILEKMAKTGGMGIRLDVKAVMDENVFVPMSELNNLRRLAVEEFIRAAADRYRR